MRGGVIATRCLLGTAVLLLSAVGPASAAEPGPPWPDDAIKLGSAWQLFNEGENRASRKAGTWVQRISLEGNSLRYDLDFQLAAARSELAPGPVIIFWRPTVNWPFNEFSDPVGYWYGEYHRTTFVPHCNEERECAATVSLLTDAGPVLDVARNAADQPTIGLEFTLVHAFGDGTEVMVLPPYDPQDDRGGTLLNSRSTWGVFFVYHLLPLRAPRIVNDGPVGAVGLDYGTGVVEALASVPPGSPPTGPIVKIDPWDPPRPDPSFFILTINLLFDSPCPEDRVFRLEDSEANDAVVLEIDLEGRQRVLDEIQLPTDHVFYAWIGHPERRGLALQTAQVHPSKGGHWELVTSNDPYEQTPISCTEAEGAMGVGRVPGQPIPDPRSPDTSMALPARDEGSVFVAIGWLLLLTGVRTWFVQVNSRSALDRT